MKVLIAPQFNEAMARLENAARQEVVALFNMVANMNREEILSSPLLTRIVSKDEGIYTLRGKHVRLFCAFDADGNILFLDVKSAHDPQIYRTEPENGETTIFGKRGDPKAYIAHDDEATIYSFNGVPLAYIDENSNIYGFNGRHLGWFEDEIIWDHKGQRLGFTSRTCPSFTQFEPFKGFKQFKPFRAFKQFAPFKPFKSYSNSNIELINFLKAGRE